MLTTADEIWGPKPFLSLSQYEALCSVGEDELRDHLTRLDKVAYRDTHRNLVAFDAEEEEPTTMQSSEATIIADEVDDAFARITR